MVPDSAAAIVRILADGRPRDRGHLAHECGIGAAALDAGLEHLSSLGVSANVGADSVSLPQPVDLLDSARILRAVPRLGADAVHVLFAVDSTNTVLAERQCAGAPAPELCTAEIQIAGKGRHGRRWLSDLGHSVVLSVSWRFALRPAELGGLPLAIGIVLAEALARDGYEGVMLKWPNDMVVEDRKLAGILVETFRAGPDSVACVIGVGFNLDLAPADSRWIDQPWTDFARSFGRVPARSELVSRAANAILDACERYRDCGFGPFAARWNERDALRGRPVRVLSGREPVDGAARGIGHDGALLVEHAGGISRCDSGEVTVRARAG